MIDSGLPKIFFTRTNSSVTAVMTRSLSSSFFCRASILSWSFCLSRSAFSLKAAGPFSKNFRWSRNSGSAGVNARSSAVSGWVDSKGRRTGSVSLAKVSGVPGAMGEAVRVAAARDKLPCLTCATAASSFASSATTCWGEGRRGARSGAAARMRLVHSPRLKRRTRSLRIFSPALPRVSILVRSIRDSSRKSFPALVAVCSSWAATNCPSAMPCARM